VAGCIVYCICPVACPVLAGLSGGCRPNKQCSHDDRRVKIPSNISFFFHLVPLVDSLDVSTSAISRKRQFLGLSRSKRGANTEAALLKAERLGAFLGPAPSDEMSLTLVAVNLHTLTGLFHDGRPRRAQVNWGPPAEESSQPSVRLELNSRYRCPAGAPLVGSGGDSEETQTEGSS